MKQIRVKTKIVFEVEYLLDLEFYETDDKHKALEMERVCVAGDPIAIIDGFEARGDGTFTTSVEVVDLEPERSKPGNVNKTWIDGYTIKSEMTTEV